VSAPGGVTPAPPAGRPAAPPAVTRLSESQLSRLWRGRRFPQGALVTRAGVPVRVVFQGRPGRGPGPDFRNAVICGPSGVTLRGDIELHVRASDFAAHGHVRDPAYASVILHVVFEDDTGIDTILPGGKTAPVIALAPWVARRAGEIERWLAQPALWREPCHHAVQRLGAAAVASSIEALGDQRLERMVAALAHDIRAGGLEQALYERLLAALGYGGNSATMLALARALRWQRLEALAAAPPAVRRLALEAALLGQAGLLPAQRGHRGPLHPHVEALASAYARMAAAPAPAAAGWKLWGVRPSNMPARRIAAAAALLEPGPPSRLLAALDAPTVAGLCAPFLALRAGGYWRDHHDPCAGPARLPAAFIGRSRALEIAANVLIPAALAAGPAPLRARARWWWERLPRPATYGATRFIEEALASEGIRVPVNARRAQGLLLLQKDWCTQNGCGRCALS